MIRIANPQVNDKVAEEIKNIIKSGQIASGNYVTQFENEFAKKNNCNYAVACNSGTSALHMALLAHGIGQGDEVITTCFSFIATANSILMCGAKPVFVDIDEHSYNINELLIADKITENTKAILLVHLFGYPCNMHYIKEIATKHNLIIIEDCCQSHFSTYYDNESHFVGSENTGCFSFYPTKNMTTGEGGIITTNDYKIYNKLLQIRNHGQVKRYYSDMLGYNYRMTNINACMGISQLENVCVNNHIRLLHAREYDNLFKFSNLVYPIVNNNVNHVYNQYSILLKDDSQRKYIMSKLLENDVESCIYYPLLMPEQSHINYDIKEFEVANFVKDRILSIPVNPTLSFDDIEYISKLINKYTSK